jgi:hypothetical protein
MVMKLSNTDRFEKYNIDALSQQLIDGARNILISA